MNPRNFISSKNLLHVALFAAIATMLILFPVGSASAEPLNHDQLYWINSGNSTIAKADLTDGGGATTVSTAGQPVTNTTVGLAFDLPVGRMYWLNRSSGIEWSTLDGTAGGTVDTDGITPGVGLAVDAAAGKLYFGVEGGRVAWANLDGSGAGLLDTTGLTIGGVSGIAIDPVTNKLYIADNVLHQIDVTNLDGTGDSSVLLSTAGADTASPIAIAIDPVSGKVFWVNLTLNTIGYANLDGTDQGAIDISGQYPQYPEGMAVDPSTKTIYVANTDNMGLPPGFITASEDGTAVGGYGVTPSSIDRTPIFPTIVKAPTNLTPPSVGGGASTGSTLICYGDIYARDVPGADLYQEPSSKVYQWTENDQVIAGANSSNYVPTSAGNYSCKVKASNPGGVASGGYVSSNNTVTVTGTPDNGGGGDGGGNNGGDGGNGGNTTLPTGPGGVTAPVVTAPATPQAVLVHLRVRPGRLTARSASDATVRFWISTNGTVDFTLERLSRKGKGVKTLTASYRVNSSQSESLSLGAIFPKTATSELRGRYRLIAQVEGGPASWAQNSFRVRR